MHFAVTSRWLERSKMEIARRVSVPAKRGQLVMKSTTAGGGVFARAPAGADRGTIPCALFEPTQRFA